MAQYTIDFYRVEHRATAAYATAEAVFDAVLALDAPPAMEEGTLTWELRDFQRSPDGLSIRGALTKLRTADLPRKARRGGAEEDLGLADDEGLVEKSFFVLYPARSLLLWQMNKGCGSPAKLRSMLKDRFAVDTYFANVVQAGAIERLLQSRKLVKNFTVTIARPTNPDLLPAGNFSDNVMQVLSETGGDKISINVRTDGRLKNGVPIVDRVKNLFADLVARDEVEKAEVELVDDDGGVEPIDLVADRIRAYAQVDHRDRYPDPGVMYAAIDNCLQQREGELAAVFGNHENAA
jgi:hypothetical protein